MVVECYDSGEELSSVSDLEPQRSQEKLAVKSRFTPSWDLHLNFIFIIFFYLIFIYFIRTNIEFSFI